MVKTKAYTLNRLINEVRALDAKKVTDYRTFVSNLSPIAGRNSAKIKVLNTFLNGKLTNVAGNFIYGVNVKNRVLNALKKRKAKGAFNYFSI